MTLTRRALLFPGAPAPAPAPVVARPPRARRALRRLSLVLIVAGALVLVDAAVTVLWQEPLSAIYTKVRQGELAGQLAALEREPASPLQLGALRRLQSEGARVAYLASAWQRRVREDGAVGRVRIPSIGADFILVRGTTPHDLESGPGVYPQTPFPALSGTTAIAGHRTTFLAPFRRIDALHRGEHIVLDMPYGRFTYTIQQLANVSPLDVSVVRSGGYARLVLSSCDPLFSAARRLVVFARLTDYVPRGAALRV